MYNRFTLAAKYINYYLRASNGKGHGVHSPFVFEFITTVLNGPAPVGAFNKVEALRKKLKQDNSMLEILDLGAGSALNASRQRSVADLARHAAKPAKYGQLLYRLVRHYQPATILEMGTSLGISTAYLAMANTKAKLITLEGAPEVARQAIRNFESLGIGNQVQLREGEFTTSLPAALQELTPLEFAFVDGNHREAPTLAYFHTLLPVMAPVSIIVFDDIHWSKGMEAAWEQIRRSEQVLLSVDLFFVGLLFFSPAFKVKQHFSIRY